MANYFPSELSCFCRAEEKMRGKELYVYAGVGIVCAGEFRTLTYG